MSSHANGADPLIRANKLDLLERVADDLAHEIKNPLHSMVINLEVLKRRITRAQPEQTGDMLRYADVLGSELERVSHRVDLLLRMVRPARGDSTTIQEAVDELRELLEVEGSRRSVEVRFAEFPSGARVAAPREPARQVILNMVLAVLDTLDAGDALQVRIENSGPEVTIHVEAHPADHGETIGAASLSGPCLEAAGVLGGQLGGRLVERGSDGPATLSLSLPVPR